MPHYSSWSWPTKSLGPLDEALVRIGEVEKDTEWENKIDKAVWRGTQWFGPDWRPGLRISLVEVGKGQEWADVEVWSEGQNNTLSIEDFCKYKYIIYAEVSPALCLTIQLETMLTVSGKILFWPPSLSPSMRVYNPHPTTHFPSPRHPQPSPRLLLPPPASFHAPTPLTPQPADRAPTRLLPRSRNGQDVAPLLPAGDSEYNLCAARLGGYRPSGRLPAEEPGGGGGHCEEAEGGDGGQGVVE